MVLIGTSVMLVVAPWLPPAKTENAAEVDLDNCNGCERCADDCPYDAIVMQPRTDGKRYELEAVVDSDLCARCGICVGACPTATPFRRQSTLVPGIDLPHLSAQHLRESIDTVTADRPRVLTFACTASDELHWLKRNKKSYVEVACCGQIPPSYLDYILSRNLSDRVLITGCGGSCRYRFGADWTMQRITRTRDPNLRRRVGAHRIALAWSDSGSLSTLLQKLEHDAEPNPAREQQR
jgi:ferredoxin